MNKRQKVNEVVYHKLIDPIVEQGGEVLIVNAGNDEILLGNRAATLGNIIILNDDATITEVLEEIEHWKQNKSKKYDKYNLNERKIRQEIDALNYILSVKDAYGIPEEEIIESKELLDYYNNEMYVMKEKGEWEV